MSLEFLIIDIDLYKIYMSILTIEVTVLFPQYNTQACEIQCLCHDSTNSTNL